MREGLHWFVSLLEDFFLLNYFNCTISTTNNVFRHHPKHALREDNGPLLQQKHRRICPSSGNRGVIIVVATVSSSAISPSYSVRRELFSLHKLSLNSLSDLSIALRVAFSRATLFMIDSMCNLSGVGWENKIGILLRLDINRSREFIPPLLVTKARR